MIHDKLLAVLSRADDMKLRAAVYNLYDSVKSCSEDDLRELHKAGRLPQGCLDYVLAVKRSRRF